MASQVKIYPVDNGDQSLISVEEDGKVTNILVDCNIRESSKGDSNPAQFDVKKDLLDSLRKRTVNSVADVPFVDIFILTHGDDDHLHGFEKNFYQGDPSRYGKKNKDDEEILIDVLWFSPMVMGSATNDDEKCFNKEAKRRIKLHIEGAAAKDLPGNRIVIVGSDGNENLSGLSTLVRKHPGNVVTKFNEKEHETFSIFIHSPYQEHLTDEEVDKNRVSLVFQARFKATANSCEFSNLVMFGGDSDHVAWSTILEKTKRYGNDKKEKALDWDILLAPHHCSWSFFNNTPQEENSVPVQTSLDFLAYHRAGAKVVASSKLIKNDTDNPPHYKARAEYIKAIGVEANFLNTAAIPDPDKPEPIIFVFTDNGPSKAPKAWKPAAITSAGGSGAAGNVVIQGKF